MKNALNNEKGLSIAELLVSMVIIALIMVTGAPSYAKLRNSIYRSMTYEQIKLDLKRAKSMALAEGARSVLSIDNGNSNYTFGLDFPPYNSPAAADSVSFYTYFPENITLSSAETVVFNAQGQLIDSSEDLNETTITMKLDGTTFATLDLYASGFAVKQ